MWDAFGLNFAGKTGLRGVPFHPEWDEMCDGSQPEAWHLRQGEGKELMCPGMSFRTGKRCVRGSSDDCQTRIQQPDLQAVESEVEARTK